MPGRASSSNAFTLIELLVVISIIALLIAILLPALSSARQVARTMQCLSTQRQFGIGQEIYASDHSGWYVPIMNLDRNGNTLYWFANRHYRDIMNAGLPDSSLGGSYWPASYICPEATFAINVSASEQPSAASCLIFRVVLLAWPIFLESGWRHP